VIGMNKKQFVYILLGIWGIISWILAFFAKDGQVEYVAGQFGVWLMIIGFCIGFYLLLTTIAYGIFKFYEMLGED
jgi:uncharacterized membrane protein